MHPGADNMNQSFLIDEMEYLSIVELTGKQMHQKKRGAIDPHLPPLLDRLSVTNANSWQETMITSGSMRGTIGGKESRQAAATKKRQKYVRTSCKLFN